MRRCFRILYCLGLLLGLLPLPAMAGNDLASMQQWQEKVRRASRGGLSAVVGLGSRRTGPIGSGVIISSDGLILSAAHVTASLGPNVIVYLSDGRHLPGRALGYHADNDASMARITSPGSFPYIKMRSEGAMAPGEWVISIGHTGGYEKRRTPPVRIGRVLQNEQAKLAGGFIYTDCTLAGGDSGGALIDLDGKLVGIHSQIGQSLLENMHVPMSVFRADWQGLVSGQRREEKSPAMHIRPDGPGTDWGQLDPMMEELMRMFPDGQAPRFMMLPLKQGAPPPRQAKEFGGLLDVCTPLIKQAVSSTVAIYENKELLVHGTIIRQDGFILTKASEVLQRNLTVHLSNGQQLAARIQRTAPSYDLALLEVDIQGLPPVSFSTADIPIGSFLAAPGRPGPPISIGVKSVMARAIASNDRGYLGVVIEDALPSGARITQVLADSPASAAGLKIHDVIIRIGRQPVDSVDDLMRIIGDAKPGFPVAVGIIRQKQKLLRSVRLANREDADANQLILDVSEFMGGELSAHRSGYPRVFQHDLTLTPEQVGGPLVDLKGRVVGLTISRAGRTKCYAIPGEDIQTLLKTPGAWRQRY